MINTALQKILEAEKKRLNETINLIASENFSSKEVRELAGSVFMHKYSEGYPGKRYYEGNENIDNLENLAIELTKNAFKLSASYGVNVQPLSGTNANIAVYNAVLNPGDKILSLYLPDGGHLSHGWSLTPGKPDQNEKIYYGGTKKVSSVSKFYNIVQYKTNPVTNLLDYHTIEEIALSEKPKLIITGGTAYPRNIDYKKIKEIAVKVGALYLADIAHEAGLIAAGVLDSPVGIADIITLTTHKTLRGPKGAVIMGREDLIDKINYSIMPGIQGGPHNGTIAAIAQAMFESQSSEFIEYAKNILNNAKILASELHGYSFNIVTGGTDKHLILIDLRDKSVTGKEFAKKLALCGIITNMNSIPNDTASPGNPSGLRIGTPFITTRGFRENEIKIVASLINQTLNTKDTKELERVKDEVRSLALKFPLSF